MADLSAYAGSTNPWEWQQWAATQDPGLYGWNQRALGVDDLALQQAALKGAGLWKPEYDAYLDSLQAATAGDGMSSGAYGNVDLSGLEGYQLADARSLNNTHLSRVLDPNGATAWQGAYTAANKALNSSDYAQIASLAAMAMGGPAGVGELIGAGTGALGSAAGGAVIGGTMGGLNASANDENIWKGILKGGVTGGAISGATTLAKDYFSGGWQPTDGGPLQAGTPIDTTALDQARAWQPTALGSAETMVGQLPAMSGGLGSIMDLSSGLPVDQIVTTGSRAALAGGQVGAMNPSLPSLPAGYAGMADVPSMSLPNLQFDAPQIAEMPTLNGGIGSLGSLPEVPQGSANIPEVGKITAPALAASPTLLPAAGGVLAGLGSLLDGSASATDYLKAGTIAAGAIAGAQGTPGQTQTSQSRTDPRFDPYLYNPGGLLDSAQSWFNANKTPNAAQQQGWQQQIGLLSDPTVTNQLGAMRNQSLGLLGTSVAGNPFATGKARLPG